MITNCEECGLEMIAGVHFWVIKACLIGLIVGITLTLIRLTVTGGPSWPNP